MKTKKTNGLSPEQQELSRLLHMNPLRVLLAKGLLFNVGGASRKLGLSEWGLRRLCILGKISHFTFGNRYYFLPSQIEGVFKHVPSTVSRKP